MGIVDDEKEKEEWRRGAQSCHPDSGQGGGPCSSPSAIKLVSPFENRLHPLRLSPHEDHTCEKCLSRSPMRSRPKDALACERDHYSAGGDERLRL